MKTSLILSSALAAVLSCAAIGTAGAADMKDMEKCYGVAKAGQNDCASNSHACAGMSKKDMDKGEWKAVKKGTCEKMQGSLMAPKA